MKPGAAFRITILCIGLALSILFCSELSAQRGDEPSSSQVTAPTEADSSQVVTEENSQSADDNEAATESPTTAEEFSHRAEDHAQNHEIEAAIADYTQAIQLDPENLEYLGARADLYNDARDFSKAFEDTEKILNADPNDLHARVLRGRMFELSGNFESALTEFNLAVEHNPASADALRQRQMYFERQGQHDKALAEGQRLIELQPGSSDGFLSQALTHVASGEFEDALKYSSAVIQKNPDSWEAYNMRAGSRAANFDLSGALEDVNKALDLSPDNAFVLCARATTYSLMGDYPRSRADLERAVAVQPEEYVFKALLADFLATCPDDNVQDGKKAAEYAKEALKLAPYDPLVWQACASAAAANGNYEEAVSWTERLLGSKTITADKRVASQVRMDAYKTHQPYREDLPKLEQKITNLQDAIDAVKNKKIDRAIALLSEIIAADPKSSTAYAVRGDVYSQLGRSSGDTKQYRKAINDYETAEKLDPADNTGVRNNLAWFLATCPDPGSRDGKKADECINASLKLHPDSGSAWDTRAAVFAENGEFDHAIEWEKKFLGRADTTDEKRRNGQTRLGLYQKHQPYREHAEKPSPGSRVTASTNPAQPEK